MTLSIQAPATLSTMADPVGAVPAVGLVEARLFAWPTTDLAQHAGVRGPIPWRGAQELIGVVEAAGLTGRGGAGFPTWRKWAAVAAGRRAVVVANGAEGEPASAKDKALLTRCPHLVLDGLQLAAEAVDADRVFVYVPRRFSASLTRLLAVRQAAGWDRRQVEVIVAAESFVSGEESAVVSAVEGGASVPRDTPKRVIVRGVGGLPTLVQNVETLAHVALLVRHGAAWFRQVGTADEPGTFVATLGGAVATPGVYEVPYGVRLGDLLGAAGGRVTAGRGSTRAVLIGGYHGTWQPADPSLRLCRASLGPLGGSVGAGVVYPLPTSHCGLAETARIVNYLADQSARQCGPCLNGLPALAATMSMLARYGREPQLAQRIQHLVSLVDGRGACRHPDGVARFVRSALRTFADEVDLHLAGACSATGRDEGVHATEVHNG